MSEPRFLAFLVANNQEEFLVDYSNRPGVVKRAWSIFPEKAKRFPTRQAAQFAIRKLEAGYPTYVVELFEDKYRYFVSADQDGPSWLVS